jgi:hypothetical protein
MSRLQSDSLYDINNIMTDDIKRKMKEYSVMSVPTTIIDGSIKVVGIPDFPWICGGDDLGVEKKISIRQEGSVDQL